MNIETQRDSLDAIAFFGGGTGGHLFPGIAVAERASERFPGCRAVFFRTQRGVEESVFSGRRLQTRCLRIHAPGKSAAGWLRYSREVARTAREVRSQLAQGFDAAFGLGGYASLPGILAAKAEGVPVILMEQNCRPGQVNRLLAPLADAVSCSFRGTRLRLSRRVEFTGNPVRREVLAAAQMRAARVPDGPLDTRNDWRLGGKRTVLVVGGSQGAQGINQALCAALPGIAEFSDRIRWIHLTGPADKDLMMEAYRKAAWEARVMDYSPELPGFMAESDLVMARAGGTTIAELALLGVPAVLIPYPHHGDRHQLANAEMLVRAGGARLLPQGELNASSLRRLFADVLFSPGTLRAMGEGALSLARPDAADAVINLALDVKKKRCLSASVSSL